MLAQPERCTRTPVGWSRWLQRTTSGGSFLPVIDGLRFVAIVSVILYHLNDYLVVKTGRQGEADWLSSVLEKGYFGVPLFFAISGFIISRPFLNGSAPGLGRYFLRRLTRLEPPYLINLLLVYALLVLVLDADPAELFPHLLASMVYMHNLLFAGVSKINFVAWSLEVEFQFYVLAPAGLALLCMAGPWGRRLALLGLVVLGGWAYGSALVNQAGLTLTLVNYFGYFAAGILAADVFVNHWGENPPTGWHGDALALLGWGLVATALLEPQFPNAALTVGVLLAVLGSLSGDLSTRLLGVPAIYLIGGMCYSLYLYHFLIISAVGRFVLPWLDPAWPLWVSLVVLAAVVVPVVLAAGAIFFLAFEKPFMRWRGIRRGVRTPTPGYPREA